jgi:hypothetical protein
MCTAPSVYTNAIAVDPTNPSTVYAVGSTALLATRFFCRA